MRQKKSEFMNKVIRQGNSLCIRIPSSVKRDLNLKEGEEILISILPQEQLFKYDEKVVKHLLKISKRIKKLKKYDELKQRFFIMLNFQFLKETSSKNKKEQEKKQLNFLNKKKKEFGLKIINEFINWGMTFNKEVFMAGKDGSLVLKSKYK